MGERFQRLYFDRIYNPIYDATTATLSRYRLLQQRCLRLLELDGAQRLLCIGLGTGNEVVAALRQEPALTVVGVDLSVSALRRTRAKLGRSAAVELKVMDARTLELADSSFDRVLCIHLLDFVSPAEAVVAEAMRVLRPGGRLVVTLPSGKEDASMGGGLFSDQVRASLRAGRGALRLLVEMLLLLPVGLLYLPLLARRHRTEYGRVAAAALFDSQPVRDLEIDEDRTYQDLILSVSKA